MASQLCGQAALHLARATHVTILYRGESLQKSMSQYLVDRIESMPEEISGAAPTPRSREAHGEERAGGDHDRRGGHDVP